jgi:hypothetical protein
MDARLLRCVARATSCAGAENMQRPFHHALGVLGLLSVATTTGGLFDIREDELECEQTAAHLEACCLAPTLDSSDCVHSSGCDTSYPLLSIRESQCLQDLSCEEITERNLCERIAALDPIVVDRDGGADAEPEEVCP